jgi:hypothetical protein
MRDCHQPADHKHQRDSGDRGEMLVDVVADALRTTSDHTADPGQEGHMRHIGAGA